MLVRFVDTAGLPQLLEVDRMYYKDGKGIFESTVSGKSLIITPVTVNDWRVLIGDMFVDEKLGIAPDRYGGRLVDNNNDKT